MKTGAAPDPASEPLEPTTAHEPSAPGARVGGATRAVKLRSAAASPARPHHPPGWTYGESR